MEQKRKKAFFFFFFYTLGLLLQHTPDIWRRWLLLRRRRRRQPYRPVPLHHGQVPDSNSSSSSHKLSHGQKWRGALYSSSSSRKQQQTHTHTHKQKKKKKKCLLNTPFPYSIGILFRPRVHHRHSQQTHTSLDDAEKLPTQQRVTIVS